LKRISLLFLFFCGFIFPQQPAGNFLLSAIHIIPSGNEYKVYYTYRLPYNKIVFEKDDNIYSAEFRIGIEVFDSTGNFVIRNSESKKITVNDYEGTNSKSAYSEGVIEFSIDKGHYNLLPVFTDLKSGDEVKLKNIDLNTHEQFVGSYLEPIITDSVESLYNNLSVCLLTNYEENIPFSEQEYGVIIPVTDINKKDIYVTISSVSDTIFEGFVNTSATFGISFKESNNRVVVLRDSGNTSTRNFYITGFSKKLEPGELTISISDSNKVKNDKEFKRAVMWYNKPMSLQNIDYAVKALKYIGENNAVQEIFKLASDKRQKALFEYWKKYDPTPATAFNQLMNEFYQRIDYTILNFSTIDGKNGADTDRGKTLIQFGKPKNIERAYNEYGKIVETWVYEKPARKFIFVDQKGTGDFLLIKNE